MALLGLLVMMDWIEAPLRSDDSAARLPAYFERAKPEEIEAFVRDELRTALQRHWMRQRVVRLLAGR